MSAFSEPNEQRLVERNQGRAAPKGNLDFEQEALKMRSKKALKGSEREADGEHKRSKK